MPTLREVALASALIWVTVPRPYIDSALGLFGISSSTFETFVTNIVSRVPEEWKTIFDAAVEKLTALDSCTVGYTVLAIAVVWVLYKLFDKVREEEKKGGS